MCIDWQALGAIATFFAGLVALSPIFTAASARKAKARNLRMRLSTKLKRLEPTIQSIANPSERLNAHAHLLIEAKDLQAFSDQIEDLLKESEVLEAEEQDAISQCVANLYLMVPMIRAGTLQPESANSLLRLIQRAITIFEQRGLMSGPPDKPWSCGGCQSDRKPISPWGLLRVKVMVMMSRSWP